MIFVQTQLISKELLYWAWGAIVMWHSEEVERAKLSDLLP